MSIREQALRYGQRRLLRKVGKAIPYVGVLVAAATVRSVIRRKGFAPGLADSALNAIPFVGALKIAAEVVRGRDFIADKQ